MKSEILDFISLINQTSPEMRRIFTEGGCWRFFLILNEVFSDAVPWYDEITGHVVTEIEGVFYDIEGVYGKNPENFKEIGKDSNLSFRDWHLYLWREKRLAKT